MVTKLIDWGVLIQNVLKSALKLVIWPIQSPTIYQRAWLIDILSGRNTVGPIVHSIPDMSRVKCKVGKVKLRTSWWWPCIMGVITKYVAD